jgi:transposase
MADGEIVLGVDTYKDIHVAAIVDEVGRLLCTSEFASSERGSEGCSRGRGSTVPCVGPASRAGSYGYGLARQLEARRKRLSSGLAVHRLRLGFRHPDGERHSEPAVGASSEWRFGRAGTASG